MARKLQHIEHGVTTLSKTSAELIPLPGRSVPAASLGIAAVERETGLSKDLLRVWERRYGFPSPERDGQGERLYPAEQVLRLRWIKRLLDAGHRPSHVVALPAAALQERLRRVAEAQSPVSRGGLPPPSAALVDELLQPLLTHDLLRLHEQLQAQLLKRGLGPYVIELLAPLVTRVGQLWAEQRLQIFEEHLFTEAVQQQLRRALAMLPPPDAADRPRMLLSTLPGEEHVLGLLMVQSLLAIDGCHCMSLGPQTPICDLAEAVRLHQADVLCLSFSSFASASLVEDGLATLLPLLPEGVELWAGGSAAALRRLSGRWQALRWLPELGSLHDETARWRESHPHTRTIR
jgi:MerR family transcriptional regulator, light-induced transcriptional regulator